MQLPPEQVCETKEQSWVYLEAGNGPAVVLYHGFPDTPHSMWPIAQAVAEAGFRCIVPYLRGYHPKTLVPGRAYDAMTLGDDSLRMVDALGLRRPLLVGHDWGASIVHSAAAQRPGGLAGIAPVAVPHPGAILPSPGLVWAVRHFFRLKQSGANSYMQKDDFAYLDELYARWAPNWNNAERDECLSRVKALFADERCLNGAVDYYRALEFFPPRLLTRNLDIPALVVGGREDVFAKSALRRSLDKYGPGSKLLLIDGAGHWPHREGQGTFIKALIAFAKQYATS